jgi:hypothetical protein
MPFSYDINLDDTARAKRRRRSQSSESIDTKALGSNLGSLARGTARFDPNAYDGDGDGLVQDNTPYERPAVLSNVSALSRGFASATGKWGDSFSGWTVGKTNEEIAEVAIPDNPSDLIAYITAHVGVHGLPNGFDNVNDLLHAMKLQDSRFDKETIDKARAALVRMLENNPDMREFIDRFGIPATVVKPMSGVAGEAYKHVLISLSLSEVDLDGKPKPKWRTAFGAVVAAVKKRHGDDVIDSLTPNGKSELPDVFAQDNIDEALPNTFIHEYGHYLHYNMMLNHPDPAVREEMFLLYNGTWGQIDQSGAGKVRGQFLRIARKILNPSERNYKSWDDKKGIRKADEKVEIIPPSAYAVMKPVELVAELFTEYVHAEDKKSIPPSNRIFVESLTGKGVQRLGFASSSRTLPASDDMTDMTPEQLAEASVPGSSEEALGALEDWSQWLIDTMGADYVEEAMDGMTAKERAQLDLKRALYYIGKGKGDKWKRAQRRAKRHKGDVVPGQVFDLSPETVQKARESLAKAFREYPDFFEHVKTFGMPPVLVSSRDDLSMGGYFNGSTGSMFIMINRALLDDIGRIAEGERGKGLPGTEWYLETGDKWTPHSTFTHEYGHFINYLSQMAHPDREARYLAGWYWRMDWDEVNPKGIKGYLYRRRWDKWRKENPTARLDRADRRWRQSAELERAVKKGEGLDWENGPPHVLSEYGQTAPVEMFAEGYSALVSNDPDRKARVSPTLKSDIQLLTGSSDNLDVLEIEVDTSQNAPRARGFASLSISRDENGTRDMARAFSGEDDSPLKGVDWLKDATPREIAQALVPRSREDLVNLSLQHMLMGNTNPDPHVLAAVKELVETMIDSDLFDFSPEGVARMEDWLEKALNESPQFLWTVRRFGSSPIIPSDPDAVQKYRDARRNGQTIPIPTVGTRRNPMTYPIQRSDVDPASGKAVFNTDEQTMDLLFDAIVDTQGIMGFNVLGLFTVINIHHREWRGLFRPDKQMPKFGRTRRVSMGRPRPGESSAYPSSDMLGRDYISNFSTSLEGTLVHEYHHQFWSSLFGIKSSLGTVPRMRDRVARVAGLDRRDLEALSGDRYSRAAYLYPNLPIDDALERMAFAKENLSNGSLSIIPQPQREFSDFAKTAILAARAIGIDPADILSRLGDYELDVLNRGRERVMNNPDMGPGFVIQTMLMNNLDPSDPANISSFFWRYGWEPAEMEDVWRGLAEDYPQVFGDPRLPFAGLAGQYAQKNPQETWAELGALMSQPDPDYRDEYITPEMTAAYLYILGEHSDPYNTNGMVKPWETPSESHGFASASRASRVERARDTVPKRSSNSLGNVASTKQPVDKQARRVTVRRGTEGHTNFSLGDYKFKIPGDRFMPEISNAYTEWASESHYDIQHISGMMMGLQQPSEVPSFLVGNTGIGRLLNGGAVSELDSNTLSELRSSATRAKRMMDEIRDSETFSLIPLYHTMSQLGEKNEILSAELGDTIHMPLTSFSPVALLPEEVPNVRSFSGEKSAIVKLAMGARVFDSNLLDSVILDGERRDMPIESITGGRFKVVSKTERNGIPYIEVEHTDVFDVDKGEFVNIDPSESMGSVKEMVLIDRSMREIEKLHNQRRLVELSDPAHDKLTREINNRTETLMYSMFGDIPEPTMNLSPEARKRILNEASTLESMPISSMDKVNLPGFASSSREMGFNRIIRPERRVAKSAIRTLQENREYIEDRMMTGRTRDVLDGEWIDQTIERLNNGEITHTDAMDIMNILMDIVSDRIRRDPSVRDATDGDVYHYQKLGKRLRRAMLNGLNDEDLETIRVEQGIVRPRGRGFASSSGNVREEIAGRFNPTTIRHNPGSEEWREDQPSRGVLGVVVYDINGEKVVFGVQDRHGMDIGDARNVPLNPYDITGLERGTPEGDKVALDWFYAHIGSGTSDGQLTDDYKQTNSTEISALLYAATMGDEEARKEFDRYAAAGKEIADRERQAEIDKAKSIAEEIRSDSGFKDNLRVMAHSILYARKRKDGEEAPYVSDEEARSYTPTAKDLVLVRWTEFEPEYDEDGNVVLGAPSEYIDVDRETIHFTLNHSVEEHWGWQQTGGGYLIMVPLTDVLDDNGTESLGNLLGVDTYFTPKPGQKLKLRKGSTVVRRVEADEDRKKITSSILQDEFGTMSVKGTPNNVDWPGFDDFVTTVAADLGTHKGGLHSENGHGMYEVFNNRAGTEGTDVRLDPFRNNDGVHAMEYRLGSMDENSILRHIDRRHGRPTGVFKIEERNPSMRGGFVSASRSRDLSSRVKDPKQAETVKSIERRIGFASRSDAVNPRGKTSEQIADELELTPDEITMLNEALLDYEDLKKVLVNPAITQEQKQRIIDSIRVRVEDGIPYLTIDPHPLVIGEIPDKRDWSLVVAPPEEVRAQIKDLLERMGEKVDVKDRATIDQRDEETKLNTVAFNTWLMDIWDKIAAQNPLPPGTEDESGTWVGGGGYIPTAFTQYFQALYNMGYSGLRYFFGEESFLNAHDLWGHVAIGRGFDRHGEWANMLAIFSLMDRWGEENNISETDILRMKGMWFQSLEYTRFGDRFIRERDETSPNSNRAWFERERGIWDSLSGMAEDDDLRELIGLLDHGREHDSANSKGFASATKDERARIVAGDVVRQSRRLAEMNLPEKGEETGEAIVREMGLTGKAARVAKEAFTRSLEAISGGRLKRYKFAEGVDEHKSRLLDSMRIVISADDIPMIMADPHPAFFGLLEDRRDWSAIEVPGDETVEAVIAKLREGNDPLARRGSGSVSDRNSGMEKFTQWASERINSIIGKTRRQDTPSRLRGTLVADDIDLDDELRILEGDSSWAALYVGSLIDGSQAYGGATDTFELLHEAIGHIAIGRGFDRHGEFANGLAVLSLLRHSEVRELLTEGEIQQVARHILRNYVVDRISQARPEATKRALGIDGEGGDGLYELMELAHDYKGDIWEVVDILERDIDKTPAFGKDGSPLEPRPRGFASSNRDTLNNATSQDLSRIVNADARHRGFASSTQEWKTTTHGIELRKEMPNTEVAHADASGTTQKRVKVGNEVVHPRTGQTVKLDSLESAIDYVEFGGNLSEVPDEFLIESILRNTSQIPGERESGWRLAKAGGRFEFLAAGGGVHGMIRIQDTKTGGYIGLKFEASVNWSRDDEVIPIVQNSAEDSVQGAVREAIANTINEELGFAPMPIRIVRRSRLGAGEEDSQAPEQRPGIAFVTELAQNRHGRIIGDGDNLRNNNTAREDISPISALRQGLIDAVMDNRDRNTGNYLLAAQPDGSIALVPIDHGEALHAVSDKSLEDMIVDRFLFARSMDLQSFGELSKNQIRQLVEDAMKDYRQDIAEKHRRIRDEAQKVIGHSTGLLSEVDGGSWTPTDSAYLYREIDEGVESVLSRWTELADMSDDEITDILWEAIGGWRNEPQQKKGFASASAPQGFASARGKSRKLVKIYGATDKPRPAPSSTGEFVRRAIPTSPEQVRSLLENSPYSKGKGVKKTMKKLEMMEVDWEKQKLLADRLGKLLDSNPEFARILSEFDIPPMFVTKWNISNGGTESPLLSMTESWFGTQGQYHTGMGVLAFPEHIATGTNKYGMGNLSAEEVIVHELAHTIHAMAVEMNESARKALQEDFVAGVKSGRGVELTSSEKEIAKMISNYAASNRLEYIAEAMREIFYPKGRAQRGLVDAHYEMLSKFLGIPVERLKAMAKARRGVSF